MENMQSKKRCINTQKSWVYVNFMSIYRELMISNIPTCYDGAVRYYRRLIDDESSKMV